MGPKWEKKQVKNMKTKWSGKKKKKKEKKKGRVKKQETLKENTIIYGKYKKWEE